MARLVSKIYGEALFDFAKEQGQLEKMCEEAYDIVTIFTLDSTLSDFLSNPKISSDEKIEFVKSFFTNKIWNNASPSSSKYFDVDIKKGEDGKLLDFLAIVINKGRQKEIVQILKYFIHLTLNEKNIGEAIVYTASELSSDKKGELEKKLVAVTRYDKFTVDYVVDKSLIAGIKIKIDDKVFDKTYKTKLFDITKSLRGLKL